LVASSLLVSNHKNDRTHDKQKRVRRRRAAAAIARQGDPEGASAQREY